MLLFINTVVHARTIYEHVWKCWYFISADFDRIIHWLLQSLDILNEKHKWCKGSYCGRKPGLTCEISS
jgi:hypothetical protein